MVPVKLQRLSAKSFIVFSAIFFLFTPAFLGSSFPEPIGGRLNEPPLRPTRGLSGLLDETGRYKYRLNQDRRWKHDAQLNRRPSRGDTSVNRTTALPPRVTASQVLDTFPDGGNVFAVSASPFHSRCFIQTISSLKSQNFLSALWRSDNQGQSWTKCDDLLQFTDVNAFAVHPLNPDIAWASGLEYQASPVKYSFFKTTDGGATWSRFGTNPNFFDNLSVLAVSRSNPNILYGAGRLPGAGASDNRMFRSDDGGMTWTVLPKRFYYHYWEDLVIDPTDPQTVYVALNQEALYKTTDGGQTWTQLAPQQISFDARYVYLDPNNRNRVFARGFYGGFLISNDAGATWQALSTTGLPSNEQIQALCRLNAGTLVGIGYTGNVYWSGNNGATWEFRREIVGAPFPGTNLIQSGQRFLFADSWNTFGSSDGELWGRSDTGIRARLAESIFVSTGTSPKGKVGAVDGTIIVGGDQELFVSFNNGATWQSRPILVESTSGELKKGGPFVSAIASHSSRSNLILCGGSSFDQTLLKSTDGGQTWRNLTNAIRPDPFTFSNLENVTAIQFSPSNPDLCYLATEGYGVFISTDGGTTWANRSQGLPRQGQRNLPIYNLVIDPQNPDRLFATDFYTLYSTVDGGRNWVVSNGTAPNTNHPAYGLAYDEPTQSLIAGLHEFTGGQFMYIGTRPMAQTTGSFTNFSQGFPTTPPSLIPTCFQRLDGNLFMGVSNLFPPTNNTGLYRFNQAAGWQNITLPRNDVSVFGLAKQAGRVFLATDRGVITVTP